MIGNFLTSSRLSESALQTLRNKLKRCKGSRAGQLVIKSLPKGIEEALTIKGTVSASSLAKESAISLVSDCSVSRGCKQIPYYLGKYFLSDIVDYGESLPQNERNLKLDSPLWKKQIPIVREAEQVLRKDHGVFINCPPGSGKTVMCLSIMAKLNLFPAVILVDQRDLVNQWIERIKSHLPGATTQYFKPKNYKDARELCDINIATIQSFLHLENKINARINCLVVDEAHAIVAPKFLTAVNHFIFRNSIALTATEKRSDGLEWVFRAYLGERVVQGAGEVMESRIIVRNFHSEYPPEWESDHHFFGCKFKVGGKFPKTAFSCEQVCEQDPEACAGAVPWGDDKYDWANMDTRLSQSTVLNKKITKMLHGMIKKGRHKIIVFMERVAQAKLLADNLKILGYDPGVYTGSTKLEKVRDKRVILTTYKKAGKGMDIKELDTAVFATVPSKWSEDQNRGRAQRGNVVGKLQPVSVYFCDLNNNLYYNKMRGVINGLKKSGLKVKYVNP